MLEADLATASRPNMAECHAGVLRSERPQRGMRMNELAAQPFLTPSGLNVRRGSPGGGKASAADTVNAVAKQAAESLSAAPQP